MAHPGERPRPTDPYFTVRHDQLSQGDVFEDVPFFAPPEYADDPWDLESADVMVLTRSCEIDKATDAGAVVQIAPVRPLDNAPLTDAQRGTLRDTDCMHRVMYLPAEQEWPERLVYLFQAEPIRKVLLLRAKRQTQLTRTATQWLLRKLVIYNTGLHAENDLPVDEDDF